MFRIVLPTIRRLISIPFKQQKNNLIQGSSFCFFYIRSKPSLTRTQYFCTYSLKLPRLKTMKLDSPEFKSLFTPELNKLIELFKKYGYELRIAGGAVRDLLMGKQPQDVDFATTATPAEMKSMFEKEKIRMINNKGEKHGTITCRINDKENFEVTTLRIDVVTDGRHAEVAFTTDWQLDSERRDLTVNSMFLGFDGTVYDYFNGQNDLKQCRVRFVGDATKRIQEDYLRILRYFRFYGRISPNGDAHDLNTLEAIQANMHGLGGISGERIWVELKKILIGKHASDIVKVMMKLGLAKYIGLTEDPNIDEFDKVWSRCRDLDPQPMTLLSALMDNDKEVYSMNERLKLSRNEVNLGLFIISHRHDDFGNDPFNYAQNLTCDTTGKERNTKDRIIELLKYVGNRESLAKFTEWNPPKFPVNGHKVMERGVKKGPALAKVLDALRQKWKESRFTLTEEELLDYVDEIKAKLKI